MCTGRATSCSNTVRRHVAATNRFECTGKFLWKSLSPQQSFVAATSQKKIKSDWICATFCGDKILLQRQRFSQKFSSTLQAICRYDVSHVSHQTEAVNNSKHEGIRMGPERSAKLSINCCCWRIFFIFFFWKNNRHFRGAISFGIVDIHHWFTWSVTFTIPFVTRPSLRFFLVFPFLVNSSPPTYTRRQPKEINFVFMAF